jgi:predicted Fe-Mo cluster-binding NifX family protein
MSKRIAIPTRGTTGLSDEVEGHFGRARHYALVDLGEHGIEGTQVIDVPYARQSPDTLPDWLRRLGVDAILSGRMGPRASESFSEMGIEPVTGAQGRVDAAVARYASENRSKEA